MASIDEIREARLNKLNLLKEKGIDPYPIVTKDGPTIAELISNFDQMGEAPIAIHGRLMAIRGQGKIIFADLDDGTGKFQVLLKHGEPTQEGDFDTFNECFDIGDFAEATGTLFISKQGEKTLLAESVRMLGKSLRPLPEKWHGLQDTEERFRKRYLDLLSNEEVKARFILRSNIISEIRQILDSAGYLEVETPALQPLYGGASAEPFVTHHNALDTELYLRISDELYLKRLLAGGLPKVYEIARDFRNEGIDATHNPEFTMLEFYEAYSDAPKQMKFVEEMLRKVSRLAPIDIDFEKKFKVETYESALKEYTNLKDPLGASATELAREAERVGASFEKSDGRAKLLDAIFKKAVRPNLIDPIFIIDYPVDYLPLTKRKDGSETLVDAFQFYAGGYELVKAFSELNDPLDQRERFLNQQKGKAAGETDTQPLDEEFLEAMEYGIPPAGGVGIGIDRLTMLFTGAKNIKEVILFPTLKPKN